MSLVVRLQALFAVLTVLFLAAGLGLVIHHARSSVHAELTSTVDLTTALIRGAMASPATGDAAPWDTDSLIDGLEAVTIRRHIRLEKQRDGAQRSLTGEAHETTRPAPVWFTWLVGFEADRHTRTVALNDTANTTLIVRAEPADEIAEAWEGARGLLALLAGFGAVAVVLIHWLLQRALRPLQRLLTGLSALEHGHYTTRLTAHGIREFDCVAHQFNNLSAALHGAREKNRRLKRQLMDVQEDERRHLAQELHDELGQCMSALQAEAVAIRNDRAPLPKRTREGAEAIRTTARHVHDLARDLIHQLHPPELDALGLEPALRAMADDWRGRHPHTLIQLDIHPDLAFLSDGWGSGIHLYRLVQEALSNGSRHSNATRLRVRLRIRGPALQLAIANDGDGFDPESTTTGFGLTGMRERVRSLCGRMRICSRPGQGTCLAFRIPLPALKAASSGMLPEGKNTTDNRQAVHQAVQNRALNPPMMVRSAPGRSPS